MKKIQIILSFLIVFALILLDISPLATNMAYSTENGEKIKATEVSAKAKPTDWSEVDWDEEIVLIEDLKEFSLQRDELQVSGHGDEVKDLELVTRKMSDQEVMDSYHVPYGVQSRVNEYVKGNGKMSMEALQKDIQKWATNNRLFNKTDELSNEDEIDNVVSTGEAVNIQQGKKSPNTSQMKPTVKIKSKSEVRENSGLFDVTLEGMKNMEEEKEKGLLSKIFGIETAYASFAIPLMEYYEGIGLNTMDSLLYYLSVTQNADGSWGENNKIEHTAEITLLLNTFDLTGNDQYSLAVQYLTNAVPENNREKAIKARLMYGLGQPYQTYLDEIIATQNANGGFGLGDYYHSDVITSLEVALALSVANYSIQDDLPEVLYYVSSQVYTDGTMRFTNDIDDSDPSYYLINKTAQYLSPFQTMTIATYGPSIVIQDKIDALLGFLDSNPPEEVIDEAMTLSTYRLYDASTGLYDDLFESVAGKQYFDGSFGDSLFSTTASMRALAQPDLVITDLVSTGNLRNQDAASFELTVQNVGYATSYDTSLYSFVDDFNTEAPNLLQGVSIAPGQTVVLQINYSDTIWFIGDTEFKFYIEDTNESDYEDNWIAKDFTFASASDGTPALPVYYIAQKYSMNNSPSVNARWAHKDDPNREAYLLLWREKGTTQWFLGSTSTNVSGAFFNFPAFQPDVTYEVTGGVLYPGYGQLWVDGLPFYTYFSDPDDWVEITMTGDDAQYNGSVAGYATDGITPISDQLVQGYGLHSFTDELGNFIEDEIGHGTSVAYVDQNYYAKIRTKFAVETGQMTQDVRVFTQLVEDTVAPTIDSLEIQFRPNFIVMNQDEVDLLLFADDNIELEEAEFYYWDPNEQFWFYLGTQGFDGMSSMVMPWYIDDQMLGTGYKIKAIVRDYQGNESLAEEWGPFEITDGTAPSFELLSPNGGEVWELGSTQTIEWNAQSVNGISTVDLYLYDPNGQNWIANDTPNDGTHTFTVDDNFNVVSSSSGVRVVGEDDVTHLESEDYSDGFITIVDNTLVPDAPWEDPYLVSDDDSVEPVIKYDSSGIAHVVYRHIDDTGGDPRTITDQFYYLTYDPTTGITTQPVLIYEDISITDSNLTGYELIRDLRVELDQNDYPHLLWSVDVLGNGCLGYNDNEVYYMYFNGSGWSVPENLSNNSTESRFADFASDSSGNMYAVWVDGQTNDASCNTTGTISMRYRKKIAGSSWNAEEQFNTTTYPPRLSIATTDNGNVHIIYNYINPDNTSHIFRTSSWSSPVQVSDGYHDTMRLVAGSGNTLHALYKKQLSDPNRHAAVYNYFDGSSWGTEEEASPVSTNFFAGNIQMDVSDNNIPHITYENSDNPENRQFLYWTTKVNGSFITPQVANRVSQTVNSSSSRIAYGPNDTLSVVWQVWNEHINKIMINHADLSNMPAPSVAPTFTFVEPNGSDDTANDSFTISWNDDDPDSNAEINLYYETDGDGQGGYNVNIVPIEEDSAVDSFDWNTSGLTDGDYYLYAVIDDGENPEVLVQNANAVTVNHSTTVTETVYEDAEDGTTNGWFISDNNPPTTINNVFDADKNSRVIEFDGGTGTENAYTLRKDDMTYWDNTDEFVIQWDHKLDGYFTIYVMVETTIGNLYLSYNPVDYNNFSGVIYHGIGSNADDNTWQTFTRDLEADFHDAHPNEDIISVEYLFVRADGRVDNIKLMGESTVDPDTDGDGLTDDEEINTYGTDPNLADTDGDGLNDYEEVITYGTDPNLADTDGDGATDGEEIAAGTDPNDDTSFPTQTTETVYEDAEDGTTNGWFISDNNPPTTINNVFDADKNSRVIEFDGGTGTENAYTLRKDDMTYWDNTDEFVIQWDHKLDGYFTIYVMVETTIGDLYLSYNPVDYNNFSGVIYHGIGLNTGDDTWRTFTRDLEADFHDAQPDEDIISVRYLFVRADGMVDNIKLMSDQP